MIKNALKTFVAIAFPWLVLLLHDNPGGAVVALAMQASIIGWIPASIWAFRVIHDLEPPTDQSKKTQI